MGCMIEGRKEGGRLLVGIIYLVWLLPLCFVLAFGLLSHCLRRYQYRSYFSLSRREERSCGAELQPRLHGILEAEAIPLVYITVP